LKVYKISSSGWRTVFDIAKKREKIKELEKETQKPDFWQNKEKAIKITKESAGLQQELAEFDKLKVEKDLQVLARKIKEKERQVFLSGKYDKGSAILSIYSGAGGQDAQDWASLLLRMYLR